MKNGLISLLQKIFGIKSYLFLFSIFTISKLKYDKNEKDFLHLFKLIPHKGIIFDIGANIGVMSVHMSKNRKLCKIISFEPIKLNFDVLTKILNFYKAKNVTCHQIALGSAKEKLKMIMPVLGKAKKHGLSHVMKNESETSTVSEQGDYYDVPSTTLDLFWEENNFSSPPIAIKIDVEGFEFEVLKGAKNILKNFKPIIYAELWIGTERNKTIEFLSQFGYKPMILKNGNLVVFDNQNVQNIYFI